MALWCDQHTCIAVKGRRYDQQTSDSSDSLPDVRTKPRLCLPQDVISGSLRGSTAPPGGHLCSSSVDTAQAGWILSELGVRTSQDTGSSCRCDVYCFSSALAGGSGGGMVHFSKRRIKIINLIIWVFWERGHLAVAALVRVGGTLGKGNS